MVRISSDRRFKFGKYNGEFVSNIVKKDPRYIEFLCTKIPWIFTDGEKQSVRNLRSREKNKDICTLSVKYRTPLEEEFYRIINKQ
jgi:hypothetical protein